MDDPTLLRTYVRERSEPAFVQLVARYLPLVHAAALRRLRGDDHRAREVTQMVFTELAQKAAKLVAHPALAAWLHQSTRWHAANLQRGESRRARHEQAAAEHLATVNTHGPAPEWDALRPVLDAALDALRDADREAVLQRFVMDRPFAAIGENLGVSENAARMRVDRALDVLRTTLTRHGITSTTAALALVLTQHVGASAPVGVSSTAVASTACQAAAGAVVAGATGAMATKILLGLCTGAAAALSIALWQQEARIERLTRELAAIHAATPSVAPAAAHPAPNAQSARLLDPVALRQIEDDILAAAELAVPLNADQQERVRLDTIIRKGELDSRYAILFRQLRLPRDQLDAFKTLLVERNQAIYDASQIAKEEGLNFATVAELDEVNRTATADIDRRIAGTFGADRLAALHEHEDLEVFRSLAGGTGLFAFPTDRTDDEALLKLARELKRAAPDFPEIAYQANGWPFEIPPAARDAIVAMRGEEAAATLDRRLGDRPTRYKLAAYVRDAVLAGKVPVSRLSGSISREYEAALAASNGASSP